MKNLKTLLPYDYLLVSLGLLSILYFRNIYFFILIAILFVFKRRYIEFVWLIILISIVFIRFILFELQPHLAIITKVYDNSYIATNFNVDIRVYSDNLLSYNDVIYIGESTKDYSKDNLYYKTDDVTKLFRIPSFRTLLYSKLNDDFSGSYLKNLLFSEYDNDINDISINASIYFFYLSLKALLGRYTRYDYLFSLVIIVFLFGLPYKVIKAIVIVLSYHFIERRSKALSIAMIIMILIYPTMIYNLSFILSFLIRYLVLFNTKLSFGFILVIVQSLFFYVVEPIMIILYQRVMKLRLLLCFILIIGEILNINFSFIEGFYLTIYHLIHLEIKGKINVIFIILTIIFIRYFKIKNPLVQTSIITLVILSNISNITSCINISDVNQGDAIILKSPLNREVILIDTGSKYNYGSLCKSLDRLGIYQIDYLIITHSDMDHIGNLKKIVNDYDVKEIIYEHIDINGKYFDLYSLNESKYDNPNDNSLVYYLSYNNLNYLFTADISSLVEREIINKFPNLKIDFLKLAHHGSNTSTSLDILRDYEVNLALISSDYKIYKHPSLEVIDKLEALGIQYFATDQTGDIFIYNLFNINFIKSGSTYYLIFK